MFRSVLVPMDCSAFGEQALPLALSIASRAGASLHLLHVHRPLAEVHPEFAPYFEDQKLVGEIKSKQRAYLDEVAARIRKRHADLEVTCAVKEGATAAAIEEYATSQKIDLVVMTTHGRGAVARFWLGSVADALVRRLPMPMLVVHPTGQSPDYESEPSLKKILLALDGSEFAEQIFAPIMELGRLLEAEFLLSRVIKPFVPENYALEGVGHLAAGLVDQLKNMEKEARGEAEQYLDRVADKFRAKMLKATPHVVVADEPASAVLEKGTPPAVDMIALATHARRGLARLFLGSVADKIVRGSVVPVFVFRPQE